MKTIVFMYMVLTHAFKVIGLALCACMASAVAYANSVGFEHDVYTGAVGDTIQVTVNYDFTDFGMFGGGLDLYFDTNALVFLGFTQADFTNTDVQVGAASPVGMPGDPGEYLGFGIGVFGFGNGFGINDANNIGTFEFLVVGAGDSGINTICGATLCLWPDILNPFYSIDGDIVNDILFNNGITEAPFIVTAVPLPAALWFFSSAICVFFGLRKYSD